MGLKILSHLLSYIRCGTICSIVIFLTWYRASLFYNLVPELHQQSHITILQSVIAASIFPQSVLKVLPNTFHM